MKPKVAYLFLTYSDVNKPLLWQQYFAGHKDTTIVCCHAANREETTTPFLRSSLIPYWVSTGWGTLGLVAAQIELIRYALRAPDVERLVLCSGSCVPIKTYQRTYELLFDQDKSWINIHREYIQRMSKVTHLDQASHRKHSQWVALTRRHAMMLVRFNYIADFGQCVVPDEHYVGSVLVHMGEEENILKREQTWARWHRISPVQSTPIEHGKVTDSDIMAMRQSQGLFARKFNADSDIDIRWHEVVTGN